MGYFWNKKEELKKEVHCLYAIDTEGTDLSKPFINEIYGRGGSFVPFGEDNLYPQVINQLYLSSPMNQACINFKTYSVCGNGYEWIDLDVKNLTQRVDIKLFENKNNFVSIVNKWVTDFVKHGRAYALLHFNGSIFDSVKEVDPEEIRCSQVTPFENAKYFWYSNEWGRGSAKLKISAYSPKNTDEWQMLELRNYIGGSRTYGLPDYASSANWAKVGGDLSLMHKSAIENGIQPSVVFRYPYIMSPEERTQWEEGMRRNAKGARNYGRAMKVESLGKDQMPEMDVVATSSNHDLFEQTSKEYKEEVAISHGINPALMGIRVAGSLGATEEIEFSAEQFKKIWVSKNKAILEDFINDVIQCFLGAKITFKTTDILTLKEAVELDGTGEMDIKNNAVNDNLKGLSAKENLDIMRITRDFSKGKLSEPIARTRLLAYGFDSELINEILD